MMYYSTHNNYILQIKIINNYINIIFEKLKFFVNIIHSNKWILIIIFISENLLNYCKYYA